jgi:hypothetical protein
LRLQARHDVEVILDAARQQQLKALLHVETKGDKEERRREISPLRIGPPKAEFAELRGNR